MANNYKLAVQGTKAVVIDWVSKGKSRQYIVDKLMTDYGMAYGGASDLYYRALKDMLPDADLFTDYKNTVIQQNLDRLEKIIETSISGNTAEKAIAIKAIDTINKTLGVYNTEKGVVINKNQEGDEQIIIKFE